MVFARRSPDGRKMDYEAVSREMMAAIARLAEGQGVVVGRQEATGDGALTVPAAGSGRDGTEVRS